MRVMQKYWSLIVFALIMAASCYLTRSAQIENASLRAQIQPATCPAAIHPVLKRKVNT